MVILKNLKNIFLVSELRKKLFFTLGVLIVVRLGGKIPVIGVDIDRLAQFMAGSKYIGGIFSHFDMFSGTALEQCTLFALGIGPYITASIMMQFLGMTVPHLEQLLKEGDYGRKIVNQYTRYLTLGLSVVYSFGLLTFLEVNHLVLQPGFAFRFMFVLSLSVGALLVMWLGEQITLFGLGNGSSMIIFSSIVAKFPGDVVKTIHSVQTGQLDVVIAFFILLFFIAVAACIVFLEKGERKIPVQYARRIVGNRIYGGQSSYIPFKINMAGVMPVIFASSMLNIPASIIGILGQKFQVLRHISEHLMSTGIVYNVFQFVLIVFFSFFYTALVFNPTELADNIKKSGGFIPGLRPGRRTADFFDYILTRIGLIGAVYLGILALLPNLMAAIIGNGMPFRLGGTSLLIVVGVGLEIAAQMESHLIEGRYEGFLTSGRLKGRRSR